MNSKKYKILFELIWIAVAIISAVLIIYPVQNSIIPDFKIYLFFAIFITITYFRWLVWTQHSILLESFYGKLILFILNIPLFFYVMSSFFNNKPIFDEYVYNLPNQIIQPYTDLNVIEYLKNITLFSSIASMILVLLMSFRLILLSFKINQVQKYYKKM